MSGTVAQVDAALALERNDRTNSLGDDPGQQRSAAVSNRRCWKPSENGLGCALVPGQLTPRVLHVHPAGRRDDWSRAGLAGQHQSNLHQDGGTSS